MKSFIMFIFVLFFMIGCAGFENGIVDVDPNTMQGLIIEQSFDTFGYTLGLFAAKDPMFKQKVEGYYNMVKEKGLTVEITNEILRKFKNEDVAYQVFAYKITSLIRLVGGRIAPNGLIESFGAINTHYIEIGKNAYLIAIENAR